MKLTIVFAILMFGGIDYSNAHDRNEITYFIDVDCVYAAKDILDNHSELNFQSPNQIDFENGFANGQVWVRVPISRKKYTESVIYQFLHTDTVQFIWKQDQFIRIKNAGGYVSHEPQGLNIPIPFLAVNNEILNNDYLFILIKAGSMKGPFVRKLPTLGLVKNQIQADITIGIAIGILFLFACYSLYIFKVTAKKLFLMLFAISVVNIIVILGFMGFGKVYVWPKTPAFNAWVDLVIMPILLVVQLIFMDIVLAFKNRKWFRLGNSIVLAGLLLFLLSYPFLERETIYKLLHIVPQGILLVQLLIAIFFTFRRVPSAKYLLIGYLGHLFLTLPYGLRDNGILESNYLTLNSPVFATVFEIGVFLLYFRSLFHSYLSEIKSNQAEVLELKSKLQDVLADQKEISSATLDFERVNSLLLEALTKREIEVIKLLITGQTNSAIAEDLFVTVNTVKKHLKSVFLKLDVKNRTEATSKISELGRS